ncbi:MAG: pyridoxal 5'-phosphate synthase glutaminase subunit PdxT [Bacteroidia bacterium]|nr:pyridoxal 5'-phosphate synthase glutaminase subunit PdxT [Bacteroidales bacterium]NCD40664.1 pyridoxal 5'-phosphate synthase glutaminase subunit PdxT [Bacteroidia bacterium]MDD2322937.1 pyridoxal 5'-phosphate synthase glutaminase subunit PdxT [Bacteroidales bacterium]MDD3011626.1 pyridoxal 5'-phosphate synthase glutaminase subunit PdxT [Bacteroidales bacterium]MDD3961926.1 pyridoxal 5'-phosphate synthase glutaminase subunit PdxT [Bacteroidales bacterium]
MRDKIGVLDLQGGVQEHLTHLEALGLEPVRVKKATDLDNLAGLILPGGESTCLARLITIFELRTPIIHAFSSGMKIWGTCAGAILIAKTIKNETPHLALMDITVDRNAFGPQVNSFQETALLPEIAPTPLTLTFIRAPQITHTGTHVNVLHTTNGTITAAESAECLATSFHPELSGSTAFHRYFAKKCGLVVSSSVSEVPLTAWTQKTKISK